MNDLFHAIGQVVRLPFFLCGLLLWLLVLVPLDILIFAYGAVTFPFAFLAAAFKNEKDDIKQHVDMLLSFSLAREAFNGLVRWQKGRSY